jgi:hypothetical protein
MGSPNLAEHSSGVSLCVPTFPYGGAEGKPSGADDI